MGSNQSLLEEKRRQLKDRLIHYQKNIAKESLLEYTKLIWKYAGTRGEFKNSWHIEAICEHLEALYKLEIRKLVIQISPRFGKSSTCSVIYPTWLWLKDPGFTIITASYGESLSVRDAVKSRDLMSKTFFKERWGDLFELKKDVNQKARYENDKGGYRISTSVAGKGTGEGGDLLIVDDPHKAQEFSSDKALRNVQEWYQGTMQSRYQNVDTFRQLLIHQRGNENDLIGYMTKIEDDWEVLSLPIEYIPTKYITKIGWKDPRTKEGEWLDRNRLSIEEGLKIKKTKPWVWYPQYQQDPGNKESSFVEEKNVRFYNSSTVPSLYVFEHFMSSWDLTDGSLEEEASYTVGQLWGIIGRNKYLLDQVKGKWKFPDQVDQFLKFKQKHPKCENHLIEFKSNARALVDTLEKNIEDNEEGFEILKNNNLIKIEPKDYGGDKLNRFNSCLLEFRNNLIYIPGKEYHYHEEIKKAILSGKNISKEFKDIRDCISQFLNWYKINPESIRVKNNSFKKEEEREILNEKDYTRQELREDFFNTNINSMSLWD